MEDATKRCPYCGEEILAVAKKCKHCGEWLEDNVPVAEPQPASSLTPEPEKASVNERCEPTPTPEPASEPTPEPEKTPVNEGKEATPTAAPVRKPGFFEYYFIDLFIRRYADFKGKTSRRQFWMGHLCFVLLLLTLFSIDVAIGEEMPICTLVGTLAFTVPFAAAAIRRLHDTGRSGWWFLIQYVPVVGPIGLLVLLARKGETKAQKVEFSLTMDYAVSAAIVLIIGASITWSLIRYNDYKRTKRAVYEEAYRSMAEAANAEKEADDDPNAIPDEVVDVANATNYYDDEQTLTANDMKLIIRYNDDRHCAYYTRQGGLNELYQYNLKNKKVRVITLINIDVPPAPNGDKPWIMQIKQINAVGDRFYIVGGNNAYAMGGIAYREYLLSYNTHEDNFSCLESGAEIELANDNRRAKITRIKVIKVAEFPPDNEVETWDEIVNLP